MQVLLIYRGLILMVFRDLGSARGRIIFETNVQEAVAEAQRGFNNGLSGLRDSMSRFGDQLIGLGAQWTALTAPVAAFGVQGVQAASRFEDALKEIEVRAGLNEDQLERVRLKALEIGRDTQFSAGQGADAFLQLLTSGQSVEEAFLTVDNVISGAAASGENLGFVSDALTDIMAAMGLEADQSGQVVQALSDAAGSSSATFSDLVQGFSNVGPIAAQFGLDVRDVAAILATFSENGIKGAEAGTQLRSMLTNMNRDTEKVQGVWGRLGISLFDAQGQIRPLNDVMMELGGAMAEMTDEERIRVLNTLGGTYGQQGLGILTAADAMGEMNDLMDQGTDVAEIAEARMETFSGAIAFLRGSIETLQIKALTPFMNTTLRGIVEGIAEVVNKVSAWIDKNPELAAQLVPIIAGVVALGPALLSVGVAFKAGALALSTFMLGVSVVTSPLFLLAGAIGAIGLAIRTDFLGVGSALAPVLAGLSLVGDAFGSFFTQLGDGLSIQDAILFGPGEFVDNIVRAFGGSFALSKEIQTMFFDAVNSAFDGSAAAAFTSGINNILEPIRTALAPLITQMSIFFTNMFDSIDLTKLLGFAQQIWALTNPVGQALTVLRIFGVSVGDIFRELVAGATRFFEALNFGGDIFQALDAAFQSSIGTNLRSGFDAIANLITTVVIPNLQALANWFMTEGLPAVLSFITGTVIPTFNDFKDILLALWDEVSPVIGQLLTWFVDDFGPAMLTLINDSVLPALDTFKQFLIDLWGVVQPHLKLLWDWFKTTGLQDILNFISSTAIPAIGTLINKFIDIWNLVSPHLLNLADWFLTTGLPNIFSFVETQIVPRITSFIDGLKKIWDDVKPSLDLLADWFQTTGFPAIMTFIETAVIPVIETLIGWISDIWRLSEFFLGLLWTWFTTGGGAGQIVHFIVNTFISTFNDIVSVISGIWGLVQDPLGSLQTGIENVFGIIKDSVDSVIAAIGEITGAIESVADFITNFDFPDLPSISNPIPGFVPIIGGADGANVRAGQPITVGERGPETFVAPSNGSIIPNSEGGGGAAITLVVNVADGRDAVRTIDDYVTQKNRELGGS